MDINQPKWRIIFGIVFAILIVAIITLATVLGTRSSGNQEQCQFVESRPSFEAPTAIASEDFTALVSFSGFVGIFTDGKEQYLPLKLLKVSTLGENASLLRLWTDCAQVSLYITHDSSSKRNSVAAIDVTLEKPVPYMRTNETNPLGFLHMCRVAPTGIEFGDNQNYVCHDGKQNTCRTNEASLVVFVMNSIKFEINGNPEKIKRGEYSKRSRHC